MRAYSSLLISPDVVISPHVVISPDKPVVVVVAWRCAGGRVQCLHRAYCVVSVNGSKTMLLYGYNIGPVGVAAIAEALKVNAECRAIAEVY